MSDKVTPLDFKFPISLLEQEGTYLLKAWKNHQTAMDARLTPVFYTGLVDLHTGLFGPPILDPTPAPVPAPENAVTDQVAKTSALGQLTQAQNDALAILEPLMTLARDSAGEAFRGQTVKLHNDYQVGNHKSRTLADILKRAGIIAASCESDATPLQKVGWLPQETTKLKDAIIAVTGPDAEQVTATGDKLDATDGRNVLANSYYTALLTEQNAASIEWMETTAGNVGVRTEFRIGMFPPKIPKKARATVTPAP